MSHAAALHVSPAASRDFSAGAQSRDPIAILDIGSNSVRLVAYRGNGRTPPVLFNEKVMCGLGVGIRQTRRLDNQAMAAALAALKRFSLLVRDMQVAAVDAVATAAVRQADNGADFLRTIRRECDLDVRLLAGDEEARLSGMGVVSGIPDAHGLVGDLGGSSLELCRVANGEVHERVSLPIGAIISGIPAPDELRGALREGLANLPWLAQLRGRPVYTVGGSWRSLGHLDMHRTGYPVPILHQYQLTAEAVSGLVASTPLLDKKKARDIPNLSDRRLPALPGAAALLDELIRHIEAPCAVISAFGLREGLLYDRLSPQTRALDPLLAACRLEAEEEGRFPEHADVLMRWMDPLFETNEPADMRRLRHAACLLADVAWRGHPDFRAERALDASLYGNWVGIDGRGRMLIGLALFCCYGGNLTPWLNDMAAKICDAGEIKTARAWGLALRLGQRLTGGTGRPLETSRLQLSARSLLLCIDAAYASLYGEVVERRLNALADALALKPRLMVK